MKSITTQPKTAFVHSIKAVAVLLLLSMSISATAQCPLAPYFTVSHTQNNGIVSWHDSSTVTGIQNPQYTLDWGDGSTENTNVYYNPTLSHAYITPATYTICLTITDSLDQSCTNTYCDAVVVTTSGATCSGYFVYNVSMSSDSIGVVSFNDIVVGAASSFHWDFGDGATDSVHHPNHTYANNGDYIVCFTASNPNSACNFTWCDTVSVSLCGASFSYANGSTAGDIDFTIHTQSGSADTYLWNFGDGGTSILANPSHAYASNGYYNVCVTVSSSTDACVYTTCQAVSINTITLCDASFAVEQDSVTASHFWIWNTSNNNANAFYHWDFGDGDTSNLQYPSHNYATAGPYLLCLTVTANGGSCTNTFCDTLQAVFRGSSPLSMSVILQGSLGIQEQSSGIANLTAYPNPAQDITAIDYSVSHTTVVELVVVDVLGNRVALLEKEQKQAGDYSTKWNVQGIANGIYFLKLKTDGQEMVKKVIVTH